VHRFPPSFGVWPPAEKSLPAAVRAHHHLLEAHVAAHRVLNDARGADVQVGVAHHLRVVEPRRPSFATDRAAARVFGRVFNDAFALAVCSGAMYGPVDRFVRNKRGFSIAHARGTQDFFGINYYSRDVVRFSLRHPGEIFVARDVPVGAEVSDLGWEVYPQGLGRLVRAWARRSGLPVYVTENGIADAADAKRGPFLTSHLSEIARAIAEDVDVRGYFHWSLLDNFE
jgi:beta-glucosidase